jgi:hypothetical protein
MGRPRAGVGGQFVEVVDVISEGQATIAGTVLVPALELVATVAEKERAGKHQFGAGVPAVLETARRDDGDGHRGVFFLERSIQRPGGAQNIGRRPAWTAGEGA